MGKVTDYLWEKAGQKGIPLTAAFELLPVCNLSCKMCYVRLNMSEVKEQGGLMTGKQWLDIAQAAKECGLLFPLLTGGEPFLHPEFREIYSGIQEMGMQISVNSNGTLIDKETAAWLGRHVPVRINITLYGASAKTYQALCGNGDAFYKMRDAVHWLKEYGVPVKFNTSITPQNIHELKDIIEFAHQVGSPIQAATYMFPPVRRDHAMIGKNERLTPEEAGRARAEADYYQSDPVWFREMAKRFSAFVPLEKAWKFADEHPFKEGLGMTCRAGNCSFWIDWQGNMVNCGMYGSVKFPLKGRKFSEAWNEMRKKTKEIRYAPVCAACPNRRLCHTCIAMISNECGNLNGRPEYLCRMNQAAALYYQKLAEKIYDS